MAEEIPSKDLTGKKVADVYGGLLHTQVSFNGSNEIQDVYDGYGNKTALSIGGENYGIRISGNIQNAGSFDISDSLSIGGNLTASNITLVGGGSANDVIFSEVGHPTSLIATRAIESGKLKVTQTGEDYEIIFGNPNVQNSKLFTLRVKNDIGSNSLGSMSHFYIKNNYTDPDEQSPLWINKSTGEVNIKKLNVESFSGGLPVGMIAMFPSLTIPSGWMECDGSEISATIYSSLCAVIGYTYGGIGDKFQIPDLRGLFVRGLDHGKGIDSNRALGTVQQDLIKKHTHEIGGGSSGSGGFHGGFGANISYTSQENPDGGTETRPKNLALVYCIKY